MKFIHELDYAKDLFLDVADAQGIADPYLVEKDYWILVL